MNDLFKNKLFWFCIGLMVFNVSIFVAGKVIVDKVVDEVIERLESNYSPSPYGPGFDPDKVEPESLQNYELKKDDPITDILKATKWNEDWDRDRGFNQ